MSNSVKDTIKSIRKIFALCNTSRIHNIKGQRGSQQSNSPITSAISPKQMQIRPFHSYNTNRSSHGATNIWEASQRLPFK